MHPRMKRERVTIRKMIGIYCQDNHKTDKNSLCLECQELFDYAMLRLQHCPFQEGKTTCGNCSVHCYKPINREKICTVMRYSGPRMPLQHPLLSLGHLIDGLRKKPIKKG